MLYEDFQKKYNDPIEIENIWNVLTLHMSINDIWKAGNFDRTLLNDSKYSSDTNVMEQPYFRYHMFNKLKKHNILGKYIREVVADNSIQPIDTPVPIKHILAEIVTDPIPYSEIKQYVIVLFDYLKNTFGFVTNDTTGFHINISIGGKKEIDWAKLLLFLGEQHELSKYDRLLNKFANSQFDQLYNYSEAFDTNFNLPKNNEYESPVLQDRDEIFTYL